MSGSFDFQLVFVTFAEMIDVLFKSLNDRKYIPLHYICRIDYVILCLHIKQYCMPYITLLVFAQTEHTRLDIAHLDSFIPFLAIGFGSRHLAAQRLSFAELLVVDETLHLLEQPLSVLELLSRLAQLLLLLLALLALAPEVLAQRVHLICLVLYQRWHVVLLHLVLLQPTLLLAMLPSQQLVVPLEGLELSIQFGHPISQSVDLDLPGR